MIAILEYCRQNSCRFRFLLLLYIYHRIAIDDSRTGHCIFFCNFLKEILVVAPVVIRRKLLPCQRADDNQFGVILQRIVHLIIDFLYNAHVKADSPSEQYHYHSQEQMRQHLMKQFHILPPILSPTYNQNHIPPLFLWTHWPVSTFYASSLFAHK